LHILIFILFDTRQEDWYDPDGMDLFPLHFPGLSIPCSNA
jgi:hypothetical protein